MAIRKCVFCLLTAFVGIGCNNAGLCTDAPNPTAAAFAAEKLPAGYVRGDVVSYSYVPNRYWGKAEGYGILPYLFEYGLMAHKDGTALEKFHEENIRRIDLASQWSTAIMLYPRQPEYRDEIVNLMIRCFKHRQLIILSDYFKPDDEKPLRKTIAILEKLWANKDRKLTNPEGDQATGLQLINNILAVKLGDENLRGLGTSGLEEMNRIFKKTLKGRVMEGQRPFQHIKTWYNLIAYCVGAYAANEEDLKKGRHKLPSNADFIGVDVYHWYLFQFSPFDPDDPNIPRQRLLDHAINWQNVITRYYPEGLKVTLGDAWHPKNRNDTHAMLQALELAGADRAMLWFIGLSTHLEKSSYTTPIETMDAYYDAIKAGPWVGLCWWEFGGYKDNVGTLAYIDKKLKHYTPQHREGLDYTQAQLEDYRRRFIRSRMRMFRDVVYNQFGYLNGQRPKEVGAAKR